MVEGKVIFSTYSRGIFLSPQLKERPPLLAIPLGLALTGNPFVRIFLFFIATLLRHGILWNWLHLHSRGMGEHPQVLKETLPADKVIKRQAEVLQQKSYPPPKKNE